MAFYISPNLDPAWKNKSKLGFVMYQNLFSKGVELVRESLYKLIFCASRSTEKVWEPLLYLDQEKLKFAHF